MEISEAERNRAVKAVALGAVLGLVLRFLSRQPGSEAPSPD